MKKREAVTVFVFKVWFNIRRQQSPSNKTCKRCALLCFPSEFSAGSTLKVSKI